MQEFGRSLMVLGVVLLGIGAVLAFGSKIPLLGKLPGDILVQRKNFTFYFPLATSIIISVVISLFIWLWSKR